MFNTRTIRSTSRAIAFTAAAALAVGSAVPAFAADPVESAKVKQEAAQPANDDMNQKVCVEDKITGSRIAYKTCKTRAQWIKQTGVDPLAAR